MTERKRKKMNAQRQKEHAGNTWRQYEAGKEYNRRIGLYQTVNENERFYRGDQWSGNMGNLPTPVFNIVKRITDYLCGAVGENSVSVLYTDETMPIRPDSARAQKIRQGVELLNRIAAYRFEKCKMESLLCRALWDAALTGDAVLYTYWDPTQPTGQAYSGDFVTELVDNVNFFVADVNSTDIQKQEYVILAGRAPVDALRREAQLAGCSPEAVASICADEGQEMAGDYSRYENTDNQAQKATYLLKFYRREDGCVSFEKSTKEVLIRRADTSMHHYPIAYFSWDPVKNSFHGNAPVSGMIDNQKYLNRAYAMVMKHMMDTAFSKVIYDKKLIPEWTNEVGQAIGIVSGGNVEGAVTTVGVGQLQSEYLDVIRMTEERTRLLYGATDTAMGESIPQNNSALQAMREASLVPLERVKRNLYQCVEDLAIIWAEMMCEYYTDGRMVLYSDTDGTHTATFDFSCLKDALLLAKVEVGTASRYGHASLCTLLDRLLEGGHITFEEYLQRLPDGVLPDRKSLLASRKGGKT